MSRPPTRVWFARDVVGLAGSLATGLPWWWSAPSRVALVDDKLVSERWPPLAPVERAS